MKQANPITLLGGALGLVAMFMPWLTLKANRLLSGEGKGLLELATPFGYLALTAWIVVIASAFSPVKFRPWLSSIAVALALLFACLFIGSGSRQLLAAAGEYARVSPGSGTYFGILAFYISLFGLSRESRYGALPSLAVLVGVLVAGTFNNLGPWLEYAQARDVFSQQFLRHMLLSLLSVFLAALLGFPLAVWAVRSKSVGNVILPVVSFLQTVPSVALFGLLLPPLAWLGRNVPLFYAVLFAAILLLGGIILQRLTRWQVAQAFSLLGAFVGGLLISIIIFQAFIGEAKALNFQSLLADAGVRGIGAAPALLALSLYALLPMVVNTVVGLRNVPEAVKDAAKGMGMSQRQVFWRTEVPLALPFVFEGLRSSLVLSFGLATIAALISAGGLGFFILRGVEGSVGDLILLGAVPVVVVALLLDLFLRAVSWFLIPKGLRL
jgi:osmoprotectant transport system permease protein